MADTKRTGWLSGIWQTLLGAAVIGAWSLWWSDRGRISKLENEKQILEAKYNDQIEHLKNQLREDNKVTWREIIIHESMLRDMQMDIIEIRTTRDVILSLVGTQESWSAPMILPAPTIEEPRDFDSYEQKAAEIDTDTLETMIEHKGAKHQQRQQQQQQGP